MSGQLQPVWSETWKAIWAPLAKHRDAPPELWSDLFSELVPPPKPPEPPATPADFDPEGRPTRPEDIAAQQAYDLALATHADRLAQFEEVSAGSRHPRSAFRHALPALGSTESQAKRTLQLGHEVIEGYGHDRLTNRYFILAQAFIDKFNLRYDLRRPFSFHPTLSGIFATLMREVKDAAQRDANISLILGEFEEAVRDLSGDSSERMIKACIQKQVNLLEALGQASPGVTARTLGDISRQIAGWPHQSVRVALGNLYGFASDYPGIRHAGNPASRLRDIDMKDMVAVSVLLAGFAPYLTHGLDAQAVYLGRD